MGWVVKATPRPLYPREWPDTHSMGGWVGSRAGLHGCEKISPPPPPLGFDPRTVQPVASRYTYYAIPAHLLYGKLNKNRYDWKFCCSYVSCRSATRSWAPTMKFLHLREAAFEMAKKYRLCQQSIKEFWSSVAPSISKPDCRSYSTGFRSFVSYSTIELSYVGAAWRMVRFVVMLSDG
jgi:hypothetical protein